MPRRARVKSPADFARNYKVDQAMSLPKRLAEFLNAAADVMPGRCIPKPLVCKVVFMLPKTPTADSRYVKDELPKISGTAKKILWHDYKRWIHYDRLEGMRATYDDADLKLVANDPLRRKLIRVRETFQDVNSNINPNKLNASERADLLSDRRGLKLMEPAMEKFRIPQIVAPPKSKKKK